jgi:hypothetical protein
MRLTRSTAIGHVAAVPPTSVMNSRRLIGFPGSITQYNRAGRGFYEGSMLCIAAKVRVAPRPDRRRGGRGSRACRRSMRKEKGSICIA